MFVPTFALKISTIAILLGLFMQMGRAQETINYASLSGRVTDSLGGSIEGAGVSAVNLPPTVFLVLLQIAMAAIGLHT